MLESSDISQKTPGQIIKAARESKNISIDEVVKKLLLSKQVVIALENDDYSKISAQVYAEGYLKAYAHFLEIPTNVILKSFHHLNVYSNIENTTSVEPSSEGRIKLVDLLKNRRVCLTLFGVVGVLVLGILIFCLTKLFVGKHPEEVTVPNVSDSNIIIDHENIETEQSSPAVSNDLELQLEKNRNDKNSSEGEAPASLDILKLNVPIKDVSILKDDIKS